jgi:hypothetical protein
MSHCQHFLSATRQERGSVIDGVQVACELSCSVDWPTVVSLLGALGVGSAIGQYVGAGRARREVRSAVLKQLAAVEENRWAYGPGHVDFMAFRASIRSLEAAALVARVPRRGVEHYVVLAQAARWITEENFEEGGGDEDVGGWLAPDFGQLVSEAARTVSNVAWSPWWKRIGLSRRLKKLRTQVTTCDGQEQRAITNAQKMFGALPAPLGLTRDNSEDAF